MECAEGPGVDQVAFTTCAASPSPVSNWAPGFEPIVGYRLVSPLGRGGFGEVWKCEAPGGLAKAIKCVKSAGGLAKQELDALQGVKEIRHPFVLSLERVEVSGDLLLIVMELADRNLLDVQVECRSMGMPGIPRKELLGLLLEAAEALDWMNFAHGLQHLDVKPHNLFVVSNHLKIADFGLVHSVPEGGSGACHRGTTPLYASPERLRGTLSRHCDQYSLAIVYQQLLTGTVPFWSPNIHQLTMKHLTAEPDVSALPSTDQPSVSRALAKDPEHRFPSCLAFLQALVRSPEGSEGSGIHPLPNQGSVHSRAEPLSPAAVDRTRVINSAPSIGSLGMPSIFEPHGTPPHESLAVSGAATTQTAAAMLTPGTVCAEYRLDQRLHQNPFGEYWLARDSDAVEYRAFCLHGIYRVEDSVVARLQALHENTELPPARILRGPGDRLVVLTDRFDQTLAERFEACTAKGMRGIPREELLHYLRGVAETLDALHERTGLVHLGLNPRNLLIEQDRLWITEYGLGPLVWVPTGQSAAQLNARYAALELFEGGSSPSSDQYSLALIYAEMVSGFHPRPRVGGPGGHRRGASARPIAKVDVDLLPSCDRPIVERALNADPEQRFASCVALIDALEDALGSSRRALPPVIPSIRLLNPRASAPTALPTVEQLTATLAAEANPALPSLLPSPPSQVGGIWEQKYPIRLIPGATALKVRGFSQHWGARLVQEKECHFVFHLEPSPHEIPGLPSVPRKRGIEMHLEFGAPDGPAGGLSEVQLRIRPLPEADPKMAEALHELGPRLMESLRSFLYASQERRSEERWACPHPVRVYPVRSDRSLDRAISAVCRNISRSGVQFLVEKPLEASHVYLHWYRSPRTAAFALLAQVMRVRQIGGADGLEIGAAFSGSGERSL
jgi:serine/threonine protein kinase